jgi:two-component system nitrogen regulation sensor histidine kinase NtrY
VARRIAHEIKNPLTPIQLSAERLKRKYLDQIKTDRDTFVICTDTIVRHVTNIGRMVDEFSAFARMPAPVFRQADLRETCQQAVFLEAGAEPNIEFQLDLPDDPVRISCDPRQVAQALTNLLRNAVQAIEARVPSPNGGLPQGLIAIRLQCEETRTTIVIEDNDKGLPAALKSRLTEPYVTTRERGTGLGLAIVKKIMEDHGGEIRLRDREGGGAEARLVFSRAPVAAVAETGGYTGR